MSRPMLDTREEQARREVGKTDVSRRVAWSLLTIAAVLLLSVPILEIREAGAGSVWSALWTAPRSAWKAFRTSGPMAANRTLLASLAAVEDNLDERSIVARRLLSPVRWVQAHVLRTGNEQVILGREGWLYFRPAVDHLTGPGFLSGDRLERRARSGATWAPPHHPDPIPAIADFSAQLATRGIGLVVLVTPVKASLHPEGLMGRDTGPIPVENPSFGAFVARLADLGIPVYAPAERLMRTRHVGPRFLHSDTHWTPSAVQETARGLAELVDRALPLPERAPARLATRATQIRGRGDLATLLRLPQDDPLTRPETIEARIVVGSNGEPWVPNPDADVLVLGDSFTNIYSQAELGWGTGAGLAEQLALALGRDVDRIAVNAGGPAASRERLAALLAAGHDRLRGKRLIVYQFAARELSGGDWRFVSLPGSRTEPGPTTLAHARDSVTAALPLMRGDLYWESRRSGAWRIWTRRLEGSAPRQLTPDEPGREHCCAHVSPNGKRVVYLSRQAPADEYPDPRTPGELRILARDGSHHRPLIEARVYGWGNRSAVWRNDGEIVTIGTDGRTYNLDVDTLAMSALTEPARGKSAWLLDATLTYAVQGAPVFSRYDAQSRRIIEGKVRSGCEPYFSHDGTFGFWVTRGGGPIHWIRLATGATGPWLTRDDPRIPGQQRYVYFPMLSRDGRMLAFGASPGDHDHFRSNYDVFVAPVLPTSLELLGRPVRLTTHPGSDRYPDLHVESLALKRWRSEAPPVPVAPAASRAPAPAAGEPFDVRATLRACSRMPTLREISPYQAALVVCEWDVETTLAGQAPGPRIRIAHWALRAGERESIASLVPGARQRLHVEPLAEFAQAENYPIFDTLPRAPLPTHYSTQP